MGQVKEFAKNNAHNVDYHHKMSMLTIVAVVAIVALIVMVVPIIN